jgi:hypothetical protein
VNAVLGLNFVECSIPGKKADTEPSEDSDTGIQINGRPVGD